MCRLEQGLTGPQRFSLSIQGLGGPLQPSCQCSLIRSDLVHALVEAIHLMHSSCQLRTCHQLETGVHQVKGVFQHMDRTNEGQ